MTSHEGLITIASMFQYLYIGEVLIFSFCLIMLQIKTRAVYLWIFSNWIALFGSFYTMSHLQNDDQNVKAIGGAIILLSSAIKAVSFSDRKLSRKQNKISNILLFIGIIPIIIIFILERTDYHLFLISISSIFIIFSAILYLLNNKLWIGLTGIKYCIFVLSITCISFLYIIFLSYPIGSETKFIPSNDKIIYQLISQSMLIFLFQISFISIIVGRQARENLFQFRRSIRIREGIIRSRGRENESAILADERYHLLKMLTHEVRQPMNSAQAALQALNNKIGSGNYAPEYIKETIENAGSTLNSIILSISNAILGATLITKGRVQKLEVTDICCVVELALLDIDEIEARRFERKFAQPVMFADADPIILRLGVRNLIENAVKYSPHQSKILLKVEIDDEQLALVISVTNEIEGSAKLGPDIFNRARRGVDKKYDGYGLGLYIAKEVAKLHRGSLCCQQSSGDTVTFELSLPA